MIAEVRPYVKRCLALFISAVLLCAPQINGLLFYGSSSCAAREKNIRAQADAPAFSATEIKFIKEGRLITIGYRVDQTPVSYITDEGIFAGLTRDILDDLSKISGLRFAYRPCPPGAVNLSWLETNHIRVVAGVPFDTKTFPETNLLLSRPYFNNEYVFMCRKNTAYDPNKKMRVAIRAGMPCLEKKLRVTYPNFVVKTYTKADQAFCAAEIEDVDYVAVNRWRAQSFISKPRFANMELSVLSSVEYPVAIGVLHYYVPQKGVDEWDSATFISIMNKSIISLDAKRVAKQAAAARDRGEEEGGLLDYVYRWQYPLCALMALGACAAACYLARRKK